MDSGGPMPLVAKDLLNFTYGSCVMAYLAICYKSILQELRPLATRIEREVSPRRESAGERFNVIVVSDIALMLNGNETDTVLVSRCPRLFQTLRQLGVNRVELDVRLEEDQIGQAFRLFFHAHSYLEKASPRAQEYHGWRGDGIASQMLSAQGLHRFCFLLYYEREHRALRITYSYCELPLSVILQHYVRHYARYGDHRALFRAAPRVALGAFALLALPAVLHTWYPGVALVLYCGIGTMAALVAGIVLRTLGSIQYTREHHDRMLKQHVQQIENLSRFPEANPSLVIELSPRGEPLYLNPAGKSLFEDLGVSESDLEQFLAPICRKSIRDSLGAPGQPFREDIVILERTFTFHYVSFPNEASVILVGFEVTYLKQIEANLRQAHALSEAQKAQIAEAYRRLDEELEVVGDIQRSLLPKVIPAASGLDIATHYEACKRAGGDYYDFFPLGEGKLGILIADVSGHGSPATVLMAITHNIAHIVHETTGEATPEAVIAQINATLTRHYEHQGDFVTALYGIYDPDGSRFTFASAGHNPPVYAKNEEGTVILLEKQCGIPLGIFENARYESSAIRLASGDIVLLYTDGITEAMDGAKALFGEERLIAALTESDGLATDRVSQLLASVARFTGHEPLNDDRTIVLLRGVVR